MNLAIRQIDANLGPHHADTFHHDVHPDLKADYTLANPLFNMSTGAATGCVRINAGNTAPLNMHNGATNEGQRPRPGH